MNDERLTQLFDAVVDGDFADILAAFEILGGLVG
jgi:hypothetical protein